MLLIRRGSDDWREPASKRFESEKALQELVMRSPTLLPGGERLAVVDELSVPGVGFVDLVGVGAEGQIVIVECKLRANPEIRREVVGQVLAYAAGLWRLSYDQFAAAFADRAKKGLHEAVVESTESDLTESELRDAVTKNLANGSFRLIVAVDEITPELRSIIEFMNDHTTGNIQVLALELLYSRDGDVELLTPVVYGEEAAERKARTSPGTAWNQSTFLDQLAIRATDAEGDFVKRLLHDGQTRGHHAHYGAGATPGMSFHYEVNGRPTSVWALYLYENASRLALQLAPLAKVAPDLAQQWLEHLRTDTTLASLLPVPSPDTLTKYPTVLITAVVPAPIQDLYLASLQRFGRAATEESPGL